MQIHIRENVVIIGNEKARISTNDSGNAVVQASELYNYIERLDYQEKYDEEYQQQIIDLFYENHIKEESYFELNVVDERMHKLTMEYAAYYLQMMRDIKKLCKDIREKENELVDQKIDEIVAAEKKNILIGGMVICAIIGVAILLYMLEIFPFLCMALGFLGIGGVVLGIGYLMENGGPSNTKNLRRNIEDIIFCEGEY